MLKLVKMNIYYSLKTKILWVLYLITILLIVVLYGMTDVEASEFILQTMIDMIKGEDALIILAIFTISLAGSKYKTGYIKNVGNHYKRYKFFLADFITAGLFSISLFLLILLVNILCVVVSQVPIAGSDILCLVPYLAVQVIQHIAVGAVILFMVNVIENTTICMAIGMSYICIFSILIWNVIDKIVQKININISVLDYVVTMNIYSIPGGFAEKLYMRMLIQAMVLMLVFGVVNILYMRKKDL